MSIKGGSIPQTINLDHGRDADKPINPKAGAMYIAEDIKKLYACFENGSFEDVAKRFNVILEPGDGSVIHTFSFSELHKSHGHMSEKDYFSFELSNPRYYFTLNGFSVKLSLKADTSNTLTLIKVYKNDEVIRAMSSINIQTSFSTITLDISEPLEEGAVYRVAVKRIESSGAGSVVLTMANVRLTGNFTISPVFQATFSETELHEYI